MTRARTGGLILALAVGVGVAAGQGLPPAQVTMPSPTLLPPAEPAAAALAGGVAQSRRQAQPLGLSLDGAIQMGLRNNLAPLLAGNADTEARAQRMEAIAALLPRVDASAGELRQKINLAAFGFSFPGFPQLVGPFNVFQASAAASMPIVNLSALQNMRASGAMQKASLADYAATRDMVVLAVANQYLLSVADQSRVTAARAELTTAASALTQAQDMLAAGTVDKLAAVRAQVQRDRQRQMLTAAENALAKQRLQLARAIGLPLDQPYTLTSQASATALALPKANAAVAEALSQRPDYRAAADAAQAAKWMVASANDERLPTLGVEGNWGTIGHTIGSNHPIFMVGATLNLPIFAGGKYRADRIRAEAQLQDAKARLADLRAQIEVQVRSALLDAQNNLEQVNVARDARSLANQELTLARDRFASGVADNLEVVQAQQAVADADESYISSLYAYNLAKAQLAQALGVATSQYQQYLPTH